MKYSKLISKDNFYEYETNLEKNIKSALSDIQNGNVISHEKLRKEVEEWN